MNTVICMHSKLCVQKKFGGKLLALIIVSLVKVA